MSTSSYGTYDSYGGYKPDVKSADSGRPDSGMDDTDILKLLRANGIYQRSDLQWFDVFYRFPRIDPFNRNTGATEHVFITRPNLNIFSSGTYTELQSQLSSDPYFKDLLRRGYNKTVMRDLQYSTDSSNPFSRILHNAKTSNLELPTISVDDEITSQNIYGTKLFYRKASDHSDEEHDFSIEFEDSKYLEVYLWFKTFDMYERKKYLGLVSPPSDAYVTNKILHDQMSIFKFIVGEDGRTIIHYSKLYGCYPKSCPRDVFSDMSADGNIKFTVNWKCTFVEDMEPNIISDFNALTGYDSNSELYLYDESVGGVLGENASSAYITLETMGLGGYKEYKLNWRSA